MEIRKITSEDIKRYRNEVLKNSSASTFDRKIFSLKKFFDWTVKEGFVDENPVEEFLKSEEEIIETKLGKIEKQRKLTSPSYNSTQAKIIAKLAGIPKLQKLAYHLFYTRPKWYTSYHKLPIASYFNYAVLIILMSGLGYGVYNQFFKTTATPLAYPTSLTRAGRYLSFQGRLTNNLSNPITVSTNMVFKLYNVDTGGTALWDSSTCAITPDVDGIFSILLGSDCGTEIPASVFSENSAIWLGVTVGTDAEATPRVQIATVAYALNAETLQGYPASESATANTIPAINSSGFLVLGSTSPKIQSTSGNFAIEGQTMTITTPDTSNGSVTINPDGTGTLNLTFEGAAPGGSAEGFVNATNANLTSGSLYYGAVASGATGYNLLQLQSGATPTNKFVVDYAGNITASGTINGLTISSGTISSGTWNGTVVGTQWGGTGQNWVGVAQGSIPYFNGTGTMSTLDAGTSGYVLITQGTSANPTWTNPVGLGTNHWQLNSDVLAPINVSNDLAIGGNATASAKFQVFGATGNITSAGTASISGSLTFKSGAASVEATTMSNLTLGGSTTGNVIINSRGSTALTANGTDLTAGGNLYLTSAGNLFLDADTAISDTGLNDAGAYLVGTYDDFTFATSTNVQGVLKEFDTTLGTLSGKDYWDLGTGTIYPTNTTLDLLLGSSATSSAKFAFTGVDSGTPTASVSGSIANVATYLDGNGNLSTTNMNNLTLGSSTTGSVIINSRGVNSITANGNGTSIAGVLTLSGNALGSPGNLTINPTGGNVNLGASDNLNLTASTNLIFGGTTSLGETTGAADSGAYIVGAFDEFTYSSSSNVQGVLKDLDTAIAGVGGTNLWQLTSESISPINSTYALNVGNTASTSAFFHVPGTNDQDAWFNLGTGKLGVGTTSPTAAFDVAGAASISGSLTFRAGAGSIQTSAMNPLTIGGSTTGDVIINSGGATALTANGANLTTGGNLTIGGSTTLGGITYTWPVSQTNGFLVDNGTGGLSWTTSLPSGTTIGFDKITTGTNLSQTLTIGDGSSLTYSGTGTINASTLIGSTWTAPGAIGSVTPNSGAFTTLSSTGATTLGNNTATVAIDSIDWNISTTGDVSGIGAISMDGAITGATGFNGLVVTANTGVITTGTWNGTAIGTQYGGTGQNWSAVAQGSIPYFSGTGTMSTLAPGTTGWVLTTQGTGANPTWTDAGSVGTNYWQLNSLVLSPANAAAYDLAIGGNATGSAFQVFAGTGNITTSGDLALNGGGLTSTGDLIINPAGGDVFLNSDNLNLTSSTNLIFGGTTSLGEITGAADSGAYIVGVYDDFTYATSTNVQGVLKEFDTKFGTLTGNDLWQLTTNSLSPVNSTYALNIGNTASTSAFFHVPGTNNQNAWFNLGTGNLGIGTTTPTAKLDVAGDASSSGSLVFRGTTPTIDILNNKTLTFQSSPGGDAGLTSIATLDPSGNLAVNGTVNGLTVSTGTITGGTWNASLIGSQYGGTGANNSTAAQYSVPYYSTTGVLGGVLAPSTAGYVLSTNSTGSAPSWIPMSATGTNYWNLGTGTIYPGNTTLDLLLGSSATSSAKFAFTGVNSGTPTASISGTTANVATYLDGNGNLSTTNMNNLTLGSSTTGNVAINSRGSAALTANGTDLTAGGNLYLASAANLFLDSDTALSDTGLNDAGAYLVGVYDDFSYSSSTNVQGVLKDLDTAIGGAGTNHWQLNSNVLAPINVSNDLAIGGNATSSAKFQVFGATGNISTANNTVDWTLNNAVDALNIDSNTLSIDALNNRVGIGTASPSQKLEVRDTDWAQIGIGDIAGTQDLYIGSSALTSSAWVWNEGATPLIFATSNTERVRIASNGNVGINTTTPLSKLSVVGTATNAIGKAAFLVDQYENQDILTASASGQTKMTLKNDGTLSLYNATSTISNTSGDITLDAASNLISFSGDDIGNIGKITASSVINAGGLSGVAYNALAGSGDAPASTAITASNDVFIGGDLELKGGLYLTGKNIFNVVGGVSTGAITLASDPTLIDSYNALSYGSWLVNNSTNNGLAALMVNQNKGGDIFSASSSGTTKFTISNAGNVQINSADPLLTFNETDNVPWQWKVSGDQWLVQRSGTDKLVLTGNSLIFKQDYLQNNASALVRIGATAASSELRLMAGGTNDYLTIQSDGDVGIGTTSPTAKLDVVGNVQSRTSGGGFYIRTTADVFRAAFYDNGTYTGLFGDGNGATPELAIEGGKIGIGTASPGNKLDIRTSTANDGIYLSNGTAWTRSLAGTLNAGAYNSIVQTGDNGIIYSAGTAGSGSFVIAPWAAATSGMRMDSGGNVGIGTSNPVSLLNLRGYTGGTSGSATAGYVKTLVIGGPYNQTYNSGSAGAVLLHLADYSNDAGDNVYPIYVEDENNNVDFYIKSGSAGRKGTIYFGAETVNTGFNSIGDQESMLPNSGFEVNNDATAAVPDTWAILTNTTGSTPTVTTDSRQGDKAVTLYATSTTEMSILSACIPITYGTTYNVYAWAKSSVVSGDGLYFRVYSYSDGNCAVFSSYTDPVSNASVATAWTKYGGTTAALNGKSARLIIYNAAPNSTSTMTIDSVRFTPSALTNTIDIAENYYSDQNLIPGQLVKASDSLTSGVSATTQGNESNLMGIVSTNPAITLGEGITGSDSQQIVRVALSGRVPTIVSSKNGDIKSGDYITSVSGIPGVGAKSVKAGRVIGMALEDKDWENSSCQTVGSYSDIVWPDDDGSDTQERPCYQLADGTYVGKIMVFVNPTWHDPGAYLADSGELQIIEDENGNYKLADASGTNIIETIGAFTKLIAANIKAGAIVTKDLTTDSFAAFQGTVDKMLVKSGLVAANIETQMITPLADATDVAIQIGKKDEITGETQTGKLSVQNVDGNEVASIDTAGTATFSGTLYADNIKSKSIDEIKDILAKVETDQALLAHAADWNINTATDTASISATNLVTTDLLTTNLYVTGQAAMNSLSLSLSLSIGTDMVVQALGTNGLGNSIDTLTSPLRIQSLAMAPIEIMAGLVKIDTLGNVLISGNLAVGGGIESGSLSLIDRTLQGLPLQGGQESTMSANLLTLQNAQGNTVSTIDASGSALFKDLTTQGLTIAGAVDATNSAVVNGVITTNATAGSGVIPSGTSEIIIKNASVTDYTLVYVTPTSSTDNYVLYVKSKSPGEFVVGFTNPLNIDVNFNWWIVRVSQ